MEQGFSKSERLCSKAAIEKLMREGKKTNSFPFRMIWLEVSISNAPVKILISVPKKIYKRAVDRNKVKRLIRETYRKNKEELYIKLIDKKLLLSLTYTSNEILTYNEMEVKIKQVLKRLTKEVTLEKID